ncbi:hypothetical protein BpHYR1_045780 [Brachionus plicatilis]|uniref:Uncharacterized protein n=1 Tax=Brachionus plicatilis TaxID=10195 RepID=A0A3M7RDJ2_BRAPC|nr:hypothetical protein BpHYR1_045780 [Brachionus plicatilis]
MNSKKSQLFNFFRISIGLTLFNDQPNIMKVKLKYLHSILHESPNPTVYEDTDQMSQYIKIKRLQWLDITKDSNRALQ